MSSADYLGNGIDWERQAVESSFKRSLRRWPIDYARQSARAIAIASRVASSLARVANWLAREGVARPPQLPRVVLPTAPRVFHVFGLSR